MLAASVGSIYRFPLHSVSGRRTTRRFKAQCGAVVCYESRGNTLVVAGDPRANSGADAAQGLREFIEFGRGQGMAVAGYYFSEELQRELADKRLLEAGVSRILDLNAFSPVGYKWRDFRRAINQGRRSNLQLLELTSTDCQHYLPAIKQMEKRWLKSRKGPKIGFLLSRIASRPVVGERWFAVVSGTGSDSEIHSFATLMPYADGRGAYLDQMIQACGGHRFAMDFLLAKVTLQLQEEKLEEFSLGFCAFQGVSGDSLYERCLRFLGHTNIIYNSRGIYHFKKKFTNREEKRFLLLDDERPLLGQIQSLVGVTYPGICPGFLEESCV